MSKFLDSNGLAYFWGKLKAYFVAKEVGKGLSTNDYTTAEKNKLAGIEAGAEVNTVTSVNGQTGAVTVPSVVMSDTAPLMDGAASAGVSDEAARGDHVHPHDISLLPIDTVTGNPVMVDAFPCPAEEVTALFAPKQSGSGNPSPNNVRPISIFGDSITVMRFGKNLLDMSAAVSGYLASTGKSISSPDAGNMTSDWIPVVSGQPFTYKCNPNITGSLAAWTGYAFYSTADLSSVIGSRTTAASYTVTVTPPAGAKYIRIGSRYMNGGSAQFEAGSSATDYAAYVASQSVTVQLGGTYYGGTLNLVTGVLSITKAFQTITGTDNWNGFSTGSKNSSAKLSLSPFPLIQSSTSGYNGAISSTGKENSKYWATAARPNEAPPNGDMSFAIGEYIGDYYIRVYRTDYSAITDLAAFKSNFPETQICYTLDVPVTYQLTPQEVEMMNGYNTFMTDADSLTIGYRCEIQKYIQKLIAALA